MKRGYGIVVCLAGSLALMVAACGGGAEPTATPVKATPQRTSAPAPTAITVLATPTPPPAATPTAISARPTPQPAPSPTPVGPQPRSGGTLQVHWFRDFRQWDTWHAAGAFSFGFTNSLMSNLVKYKPGSSDITGDLAERWEVGQEGKALTFHLRKDAQWHDGKPVTSKDVLYNFQRGSNPSFTFNRARVAPIATMEAPDDYTFKITLKDTSNRFFGGIATPFVMIYPAHVPDMAQWHKSAVGSGPFKLKEDKPESLIAVERNPNYFLKDAQGRKTPYLDAINFHTIGDAALALGAFRTGRIQCACVFAIAYVLDNDEQLRKEMPAAQFYTYVGSIIQLYFNTKRAPFDNLAFRQAAAIGLDKETIGATFARGKTFRPAPSLIPPELGGQWGLPRAELQKIPGYRANHADDLARARQKFQESGIDPRRTRTEIQTDPTYQTVGELAASLFSTELGLATKTDLGSGSIAEVSQRRVRGDFALYIMSENGAFDDPLDYHDTRLLTGGALNYGGWSNPRYDQLMTAQDKELDARKRRELAWELQRIELTEFPKVPLFWVQGLKAAWPEVRNLKIGPLILQNYDFTQVWLEK